MAAKKENMELKKEELKAKYGDTVVMGVNADIVRPHLKSIFTKKEDAWVEREMDGYPFRSPLLSVINENMKPMLRCEAELDPEFKQVIMYVILRHQDKVFCTHRLNGGDARLAGGYSIGTGGHTDNGETIYDAMYRELTEEVGLKQDQIMAYGVNGFILDESTAVNSVHLGIVVSMVITTDEIECKEKGKLEGEWVDYKKLEKLYKKNALESWSMIAAKEVLGVG